MLTRSPDLRAVSVRADRTAALMQETGLDETSLRRFVEEFYTRMRAEPVLGPIFAARITDWEPHLRRMTDFWSSVALMTGRYRGRPVEAHAGLPINWTHFERWLVLFRQTAMDSLPPDGAAHLIERAERIARSLHVATCEHDPAAAPFVPTNIRGGKP